MISKLTQSDIIYRHKLLKVVYCNTRQTTAPFSHTRWQTVPHESSRSAAPNNVLLGFEARDAARITAGEDEDEPEVVALPFDDFKKLGFALRMPMVVVLDKEGGEMDVYGRKLPVYFIAYGGSSSSSSSSSKSNNK